MKTRYTIKNFRVFDEKGATIDVNPITILTGCNSSGKSSIVKSMVLLNTYIDSIQKDYNVFKEIDLKKHKLDFTKDTTISLGNFNRVRNKGSKGNTITFMYQVHSLLLGEDIKVSMEFSSDKNDALNEGYLKKITIYNLDDDIIYTSSEDEPCTANYNLILKNFFRFSLGQLVVSLKNEYSYRRFYLFGLQPEEEFHANISKMPSDARISIEDREKELNIFKNMVDNILSSYISSYGEESLKDITEWERINGADHWDFTANTTKKDPLIVRWLSGHKEILETSLNKGTLFFFPLLEKLDNVDSSSFKDTILQLLDGIKIEKEVLLAIDKISADFIKSGKKTFGEYFKMHEEAFLNFTDKRFKNDAPYMDGGKFLKVDTFFGKQIHDESYLQWTRRLLGPSFTETPNGNMVSVIGIGEKEEWENCPVNFNILYDIMMNLNNLIDDSDSNFYGKKNIHPKDCYHTFHHYLFDMFAEYISMCQEEIVTSAMPQNLSYIGTSLVSVKRDYALDSNDNFSNLIKRYLSAQRKYKEIKGTNTFVEGSFLSRWIQKLEIGHSISIEVNPSGSSFVVRLFKSSDDKEGRILADEGYGITQLVTILIRIETAIMESEKKYLSRPHLSSDDENDDNLVKNKYVESTIAIEEPEVHLHPMFQSMLAEMFAEAYSNYNIHFIVETHSEYIIRKLQLLVANKKIVNSDISILYVYDEKRRPGYEPQVKRIGITDNGTLDGHFGEGFFDEADTLSMSLLMVGGAEYE